MNLKKSLVSTAIAMTIGTAVVPQIATADILTFDYSGWFTMLDGNGAGFANTSIDNVTNKTANQYQTAITGTMTFDTSNGSGSGTLVPFDFFAGTLPATATGIAMQAIGDGMGDPNGPLVLVNMLFNWNGTNGIPTSLVLDASGMFGALQGGLNIGDTVSGVGSIPASDGTYVASTAIDGSVTGPGGYVGYLGLGPSPVVTTAWNLTSTCTRAGSANDGACMNLLPSGSTPLVTDTKTNTYDYVTPNTGGTIGGNPMIDGPFAGNNANFNITSLKLTNVVPAVPVPAAVWLFGSGLVGLVGIARRKKV